MLVNLEMVDSEMSGFALHLENPNAFVVCGGYGKCGKTYNNENGVPDHRCLTLAYPHLIQLSILLSEVLTTKCVQSSLQGYVWHVVLYCIIL